MTQMDNGMTCVYKMIQTLVFLVLVLAIQPIRLNAQSRSSVSYTVSDGRIVSPTNLLILNDFVQMGISNILAGDTNIILVVANGTLWISNAMPGSITYAGNASVTNGSMISPVYDYLNGTNRFRSFDVNYGLQIINQGTNIEFLVDGSVIPDRSELLSSSNTLFTFTLTTSNSVRLVAGLDETNHVNAVLQSVTNYANGVTNSSLVRQTELVNASNAVYTFAVEKQTGSMILSNLIAMGITNITAGTNTILYTNNGTLVINATVDSLTPWISDINGNTFSLTNVSRLGLGTTADSGTQNSSFVMNGTNSSGQTVLLRFRNTNSLWQIESSVNGASYISDLTLSSAGSIVIPGTATAGGFTAGTTGNFTAAGWGLMNYQADGVVRFNRTAAFDLYGISIGGSSVSNGLMQFISVPAAVGTLRLVTGNTNGFLNVEAGALKINSLSVTSNVADYPTKFPTRTLVLTNTTGGLGYKGVMPALMTKRMSYITSYGSGTLTVGEGFGTASSGGGAIAYLRATTNSFVATQATSGTTTNGRAGGWGYGFGTETLVIYPGHNLTWAWTGRIGNTNLARSRYFIGINGSIDFPAAATNASQATRHSAMFRYSTIESDTTWKFVTSDGSAQTVTDTLITVTTNRVKLEMIEDYANLRWIAYVDGVVAATNSANLPAAALGTFMSVHTTDAINKALYFEAAYHEMDY